jgi:hypothetical protein
MRGDVASELDRSFFYSRDSRKAVYRAVGSGFRKNDFGERSSTEGDY